MDTTKLTLRVDLGSGRALGPGKIRLLEAIEKTETISQAGRKLGMSYRRAWLLVDDMNNCFCDPVINAQSGGARGGGATLTSFGQKLVERYRAIEADALVATRQAARAGQDIVQSRARPMVRGVGGHSSRKCDARQWERRDGQARHLAYDVGGAAAVAERDVCTIRQKDSLNGALPGDERGSLVPAAV
jgi:molybdate transport system regulatory protein